MKLLSPISSSTVRYVLRSVCTEIEAFITDIKEDCKHLNLNRTVTESIEPKDHRTSLNSIQRKKIEKLGRDDFYRERAEKKNLELTCGSPLSVIQYC